MIPTLSLGTQIYYEDNTINLTINTLNPTVKSVGRFIEITRVERRLTIQSHISIFWKLLKLSYSELTIEQILCRLPIEIRNTSKRLLRCLIDAEVMETFGRPYNKFIYNIAKNPTLNPPNLSLSEIEKLVTETEGIDYPREDSISMDTPISEEPNYLKQLFLNRRSNRRYSGKPISFSEVKTIISTACGVTSSLNLPSGKVYLRAYPSPGALYSIKIYLTPLNVIGLSSGVYYYHPMSNSLNIIKDEINVDIKSLALPDVRPTISGSALFISLTANFYKSEKKYGLGAYRTVAAEAGCIAENIIIVSNSIGVDAGPFGGIFDDLLIENFGINADEHFMLGVILGHSEGDK